MKARKHRLKVLRTGSDHGRKTDRRIHRIAPADPIPEPEHIRGVDAKSRHFTRIRGDGDKVPRNRFFIAQGRETPFPRRPRVEHCFESRECLRRDDEQRLFGIQIVRGFREIGSIDVRDETKCQVTLAVITERFIRHYGTKIGAADADIDNVANRFSGVTSPGSAADLACERAHPVENLVNLRRHVFPIGENGLIAWGPQRYVQHGALFRHVDFIAAKHRVDALTQTALPRQIE